MADNSYSVWNWSVFTRIFDNINLTEDQRNDRIIDLLLNLVVDKDRKKTIVSMIDVQHNTFIHHLALTEGYSSLIMEFEDMFPGIVAECERVHMYDYLLEVANPSNYRALIECGANIKGDLHAHFGSVVNSAIKRNSNFDPKYLPDIHYLIANTGMTIMEQNIAKYQLLTQHKDILASLLPHHIHTLVPTLQDVRFDLAGDLPNIECAKVLMKYGVTFRQSITTITYIRWMVQHQLQEYIKLLYITGSYIETNCIIYKIAELYDSIRLLSSNFVHDELVDAIEFLLFVKFGKYIPSDFTFTTEVMRIFSPKVRFEISIKNSSVILRNLDAGGNVQLVNVFDGNVNPMCKKLSRYGFDIMKSRILEVCIALQYMGLPVLVTIKIIHALLPASKYILLYMLWDLCAKVKHSLAAPYGS